MTRNLFELKNLHLKNSSQQKNNFGSEIFLQNISQSMNNIANFFIPPEKSLQALPVRKKN